MGELRGSRIFVFPLSLLLTQLIKHLYPALSIPPRLSPDFSPNAYQAGISPHANGNSGGKLTCNPCLEGT